MEAAGFEAALRERQEGGAATGLSSIPLPSQWHDDALVDAFAAALVDMWQRLDLPFATKLIAAK